MVCDGIAEFIFVGDFHPYSHGIDRRSSDDQKLYTAHIQSIGRIMVSICNRIGINRNSLHGFNENENRKMFYFWNSLFHREYPSDTK